MVGVMFLGLDYVVCARAQALCPWGPIVGKVSFAIDGFVEWVGKGLGVRYGYVPYFPNRATEVFLLILSLILPWLLWFVTGVSVYLLAHCVRDLRPSSDRQSRRG